MIAFLTGRIAGIGQGFCLLDVQGVGYRISMSTGSLAALPVVGDEVTVHTYMHVREDEVALFGFESELEKEAFEQLITVSGVGPKVALSTLSALTPEALASAIASEDVGLISSVPGIGKKTAQRIILDLADKFTAPDGRGAGSSSATRAGNGAAATEARDALLSMGFSAGEVAAALKSAEGADSQGLLKSALRRLGGGDA